MEIVDLSVPLENNVGEIAPFLITQIGHRRGGDIFGRNLIFKSKVPFTKKISFLVDFFLNKNKINHKTFPQGEFLNLEILNLTTHTGTHIDSPFHYGSRSEGKASPRIDELPLDWCFSDGVILDLSHKKDSENITLLDVQKAEKYINYKIKAFDIVLIRTDASENWGKPNYSTSYPSIDKEVIEYLTAKGVKIIGVDTFGFDKPFFKMLKDFEDKKDNSVLWPTHFYGREKSYFHIERLCNLDKVRKSFGFKICCFPIKIKGAGAAWSRVVAIL